MPCVEECGCVRWSAEDGAKGTRLYDWTIVDIWPLRVDIWPLREPGKVDWLLARRSLANLWGISLLRSLWPGGDNSGRNW